MKRLKRSSAGFTLVELMIVVTIVAVLAAIGVAAYGRVTKRSRINEAVQFMAAVHAGEELYYTDNERYCGNAPATVPDLDCNSTSCAFWDPSNSNLIKGRATNWTPDAIWASCQVNAPSRTRFRYVLVAGGGGTACNDVADMSTQFHGSVDVQPCASVNTAGHWYYIIAQADQDDDGRFSAFGASSGQTDFHWSIEGIELE